MVTFEKLKQILPIYADEVKLFFYSYGLADLIVDAPVQHVAIKALNSEMYQRYLEEYKPHCSSMDSEAVGEREITMAHLTEPIDAATFGTTTTVEIMEPKPGAIATTHNMIDHIDLKVKDLEAAKEQLKNKDIDFVVQENGEYKAIVVEITEWGQEVKLTQ